MTTLADDRVRVSPSHFITFPARRQDRCAARYLASLKWTETELRAYQDRALGVRCRYLKWKLRQANANN